MWVSQHRVLRSAHRGHTLRFSLGPGACNRHRGLFAVAVALCMILTWHFSWELYVTWYHLMKPTNLLVSTRVPLSITPLDSQDLSVGSGIAIHTMLEDHSISLQQVERGMLETVGGFRTYARLQLIDNRLYLVPAPFRARERLDATTNTLLEVVQRATAQGLSLPNVDFLYFFYDGCDTQCSRAVTAPILLLCRPLTCSGGLLVPEYFLSRTCGWKGKLSEMLGDMGRNDVDFPPELKRAQLFWRGSTTGQLEDHNWWEKARPRLVLLTRSFPALIDARFTQLVDVDRAPAFRTVFEGSIARTVPMRDSMQWSMMADVDGHTWSGRFPRLLRTNSLILKNSSFQTFFSAHMRTMNVAQLVRDVRNPQELQELQKSSNSTHFLGMHPPPEVLLFDLDSMYVDLPRVVQLLNGMSLEAHLGVVRSAQQFALRHLNHDSVLRHWHDVLQAYARKQAFVPQVHADAVLVKRAPDRSGC